MKRTICLILGVASLGVSAFVFWRTFVLYTIPPVFESKAKILVRVVNPKPPGWSMESEARLFESKEVLSQVITKLDLAKRWGDKYKESELRFDTTYTLLRAQIDIHPVDGANIIHIRARSEDASEAAVIANTIVDTTILESRKIVQIPLWQSTAVPINSRPSIPTIVSRATPNPRPVHPSRFQKAAYPIGGLIAVVFGIMMFIRASTIPKRPSPPPTPS